MVKKILTTAIDLSVRIIILAMVIMAVHRACIWGYNFGFNIFAERSMTVGRGQDVSIMVGEKDSVVDVANTLKDKRLIDDVILFYCQELLSAYHGDIKPGYYTLNTSMTPTQMLEIMSGGEENEELEADEAKGDSK